MDFERQSLFTGWMLLSYKKKATASSSLDGHEPEMAVNEDVRSWWSAASGKKGEWLSIDLGHDCDVHAIQLSFADQDARLRDTDHIAPYKYLIEGSSDGKRWNVLTDKSRNKTDRVHDYISFDRAIKLRYLKITCLSVPAGKFSVAGFRVFGKGPGAKPPAVTKVTAKRDTSNRHKVSLTWPVSKGATGCTTESLLINFLIQLWCMATVYYHSMASTVVPTIILELTHLMKRALQKGRRLANKLLQKKKPVSHN